MAGQNVTSDFGNLALAWRAIIPCLPRLLPRGDASCLNCNGEDGQLQQNLLNKASGELESVLCSATAVLFLLGQVIPLSVVFWGKEATYGFNIPHPEMLFLTGFATSPHGTWGNNRLR